MIIVIGGNGRLGKAIARQYSDDTVICPERAVYQNWSTPGAQDAVASWLAPLAGNGATVFVASGLLDPRLAPEALSAVNLELPRNIIEGAAIHGLKVITFGTVMEALVATHNPYVRSKLALAKLVAERAAVGAAVAHLRIHTLYGGGLPSRFMFLGQILDALQSGAPFQMTQGRQLREYHHVDDDARAIRLLADTHASGVLDLSHGAPLSLRDLASSIFGAFDAAAQLQVGALLEPAEENYNTRFARQPLVEQVVFREALPAVIAYLEQCGVQRKNGQ